MVRSTDKLAGLLGRRRVRLRLLLFCCPGEGRFDPGCCSGITSLEALAEDAGGMLSISRTRGLLGFVALGDLVLPVAAAGPLLSFSADGSLSRGADPGRTSVAFSRRRGALSLKKLLPPRLDAG
ncbi:MAG: hypothetical protein ACR2L3_04105 [Actinomycetota bacterium]